MFMNEGIECQSISPAVSEVSDIDIRVASRLHLTPEQQRIFGRFYFRPLDLFNGNVLDLNTKCTSEKKITLQTI